MTEAEWISFDDRLPDCSDADPSGYVRLLETNGKQRDGLYNWIPATSFRGPLDVAAYWRTNGFTHWRPKASGQERSPDVSQAK